ncbi:iron-sulfur cluster assembly accessory protein [Sinorhizobium terangae]|uniref:Iron-sulfur cluster assembly accessory protein n=1 Tax=Sinorhizobium terangae TaxID=110322 RepID=A0A6N7LMA8_SINTE|nr:iron-sulfur cluster assembly accessory protein [Sinorhizobium terangae]MBB4188741.1 iron-sulfur cluster assembly accessory protein [Sinorhizobium terangae]MQX18887.1 iron-sulfur cluster assembly accessory protein [Sinorhizobium terangae]
MITLTDSAIAAVKFALSQADEPVSGLRITVEAGGCSGFRYHLGLESESREGDAVIETSGVKVFVDSDSQPHVGGMTVDFTTGVNSPGFIFDNPNARENCTCGKSFS